MIVSLIMEHLSSWWGRRGYDRIINYGASLFLVGPSWLWSYRELWSISLLGGAVVVMIVSWIMEHLSSWWGRRGYDRIVNYGASLFLVGPSWLWLYRELWSISLLGGAVVVMIVSWIMEHLSSWWGVVVMIVSLIMEHLSSWWGRRGYDRIVNYGASLLLVGPSWLWSYRELWSISLLGGAVVVMIVSWIMEHLSSWWGRRGYDRIVNYGASLFLVGRRGYDCIINYGASLFLVGRRGYDRIVNYGASLFLVGPSWLWSYRELWSISRLGGASWLWLYH